MSIKVIQNEHSANKALKDLGLFYPPAKIYSIGGSPGDSDRNKFVLDTLKGLYNIITIYAPENQKLVLYKDTDDVKKAYSVTANLFLAVIQKTPGVFVEYWDGTNNLLVKSVGRFECFKKAMVLQNVDHSEELVELFTAIRKFLHVKYHEKKDLIEEFLVFDAIKFINKFLKTEIAAETEFVTGKDDSAIQTVVRILTKVVAKLDEFSEATTKLTELLDVLLDEGALKGEYKNVINVKDILTLIKQVLSFHFRDYLDYNDEKEAMKFIIELNTKYDMLLEFFNNIYEEGHSKE